MKRIKILLLSMAFISLIGCEDDFLDRPAEDQIDASQFFITESQLETYTNSFYDNLPGQSVYTDDAASDNIVPLLLNERVRGTRIVPTGSGTGFWNWEDLRDINFFLENAERAEDPEAAARFTGLAKFFRAFFYFDKVKRFGDVPWYDKVLQADDPDLFKPRDPRELVMQNVLLDINEAINNLPAEVELNRVTRYTALALKSRIFLFEGTFRKYHGLGDYEPYLNESIAASEQLLNSGVYGLYNNGDPQTTYRELFDLVGQNTSETILARNYDANFITHNTGNLSTSPTNGAYGIPKDLVFSYLVADGSRFTDIPGYETFEYFSEMQNRDPRLTQTTAGPNFTAYLETVPEPVNLSGTTTGYRIIKNISSKDQWGNRSSINDIILFRFAEVLLNYAEAKAELGTLDQADLDISINRLRARVGMPDLTMSDANASPDPFLENSYPNVESGGNKGVILEIRRERRIELFMEGHRWDDLMRWKEGKKVEQPFLGIYFSSLGGFDFDNDGSVDVYLHDGDASGAPTSTQTLINVTERTLTNGTSGYLDPIPETRIFDESRDYFYPIPIEDLNLNENLTQNPGW